MSKAKPAMIPTYPDSRKRMEPFTFVNGHALVHSRSLETCMGQYCSIHGSSNHKMVRWPMLLRETGLIERLCVHNVGHPDPDSAAWLTRVTGDKYWGIHGCDGCCHGNI